ncbi:MAG: DUF2760 domain-containing protein [Bryobacteraceae bacterium]
MSRILLAFQAFFGILFSGNLSDSVLMSLKLSRRPGVAPGAPPAGKPSAKTEPSKPAPPAALPADGAVQILGLLQTEARLIDFLQEDISAYADDQIGAAVRDIHANAHGVLERYVKLVPVVDGVEGAVTQITALGLNPKKDAAMLKIVGNVPADGKVQAGVLNHRGWRAEKVDLPPIKPGDRVTVVAPAEIEVE